MTEITLKRSDNTTQITVSGHSKAKRVNDIDLCCCGVSTLVFTLLKSLSKLNPKNFRYTVTKGFCNVSFDDKEAQCCDVSTVVDTVMNGFVLLRETYPENIRLKILNLTQKGVTCI